MKIKNPQGKKKIVVKKDEFLQIWLEDLDLLDGEKSREFFLEIDLVGENAQCLVEGRISAQNLDKKSWKIVQKFRGKNQVGKINLQGVADDKSLLGLQAQGVLESSSEEAQANIAEKVLIFKEAKGELLPILTVKTDNVRQAKHSASITPVDQEKLLFLASRGLNIEEAEDILKKGFLN